MSRFWRNKRAKLSSNHGSKSSPDVLLESKKQEELREQLTPKFVNNIRSDTDTINSNTNTNTNTNINSNNKCTPIEYSESLTTEDLKFNNDAISNDAINNEIESFESNHIRILHEIKELIKKGQHRIDYEKYYNLVKWVDFNPDFFKILEQAWNDKTFWPFLSTENAAELVFDNPNTIVIRLSTTHPGTITVTRMPHKNFGRKMSKKDVRNVRYFPSQTERGKLDVPKSKKSVNWESLLHYLHQDQCCICLNELINYVTRLECGHHFHTQCINKHKNSQHQSSKFCPLCRQPISKETLLKHENEFQIYKPINTLSVKKHIKSKSVQINPKKLNFKKSITITINNSNNNNNNNDNSSYNFNNNQTVFIPESKTAETPTSNNIKITSFKMNNNSDDESHQIIKQQTNHIHSIPKNLDSK